MHLLVIVDQTSRCKDAQDVDDFISAEFPDKNQDPVLYGLVLQWMTHGPCGPKCQDNHGQCTKKFPKPWCEETTFDPNSFVSYRRRNTGVTHQRWPDGFAYDNSHVVPHSWYFLKKY